MTVNYTKLSTREKNSLWIACKQGNKEGRERLIELNLALVGAVAKRYTHKPDEYSELFQGGVVGLIKAIDGFKPEKGVEFSSYAFPFIHGEILRQKESLLGVKRQRKNEILRRQLNDYIEDFLQSYKRMPSVKEIASELSLNEEEIIWCQEIDLTAEPEASMNDKQFDVIENRLFLKTLLQELTDKERNILLKRYWEGKTQSAIGKDLGLSQTQISRLEKEILQKLKRIVDSEKV